MIAVIDYGTGNLRSVQKAFEHVGANAQITQNADDILSAEKIVLPGVGAIAPAMKRLRSLDLVEPIKNAIKSGKPFLGICLGLQLLFEKSEEGGSVKALSIFSGSVKKSSGSSSSFSNAGGDETSYLSRNISMASLSLFLFCVANNNFFNGGNLNND